MPVIVFAIMYISPLLWRKSAIKMLNATNSCQTIMSVLMTAMQSILIINFIRFINKNIIFAYSLNSSIINLSNYKILRRG